MQTLSIISIIIIIILTIIFLKKTNSKNIIINNLFIISKTIYIYKNINYIIYFIKIIKI